MELVDTGAVLSPCGQYRYRLWRTWDTALPSVAFIMLNPSTADATEDDPTIRRCIGFAKAWGCGGIKVVNLFAWRATDPSRLTARSGCPNPIGPDNDRHILEVLRACSPRVCAWGNHGALLGRDSEVKALLASAGFVTCCLRMSKDGHPGHPLYLPANSALLPFTPERAEARLSEEAEKTTT